MEGSDVEKEEGTSHLKATRQNEATRTDDRPWFSDLRGRYHAACLVFMSKHKNTDQKSLLIQSWALTCRCHPLIAQWLLLYEASGLRFTNNSYQANSLSQWSHEWSKELPMVQGKETVGVDLKYFHCAF